MSLKEYNKKRNFNQTSEPEGDEKKSGKRLRFVVQRHAATRLHYDFRLEMDGVLKSWAVPKGPSLNPNDKRLAMMVEDHPYSYRTFEGTIPKGNYGAGEVEIWDEGFYEPINKISGKDAESILLQELHSGSLKFILKGKKLKGEFALVKIKNSKDENAWLLIKHKDEFAVKDAYDAENFTSKNSKVTQLVEEKKTKSSKKSSAEKPSVESKRYRNFDKYISSEKKLTNYIKPMLATLIEESFDDKDWVFEIKWDGYRAIAELKDTFKFYSRNGLSFAEKYKPITDGLKKQQHEMILDGEIVAYNKDGFPSFQALQQYGEHPETLIIYHVFDLLYLNGHSTESLTLLQRKELLKDALTETEHIKYCDHVENDGIAFFEAIKKNNVEGMIAKAKESNYTEGIRSRQWLKIKNVNTAEAVIAGFTEPRGSRKKFGALILGNYEDDKLVYCGHTGTGFDENTLDFVADQLQPLIIKECPFDVKPKTNTPATWVAPKLVCSIKFSEITKDGIYRHPVFIGLREDKEAQEVNKDEEIKLDESAEERKKSSAKKSSNVKEGNTTIGGKKLKLTNLDKIYWPDENISKGDMINYYQQISSYILPYLKGRPQSLHRHPNGIKQLGFYHKDAGAAAPDWIETMQIHSESADKEIEYVLCNSKAALAYLNNLGCIELNVWNSKVNKIDKPDYLIIDLDPSEKNSFDQVIETALIAKEILDSCSTDAYCKTSGSTGIHIFIPMGAKYTYEQVRNFAHLLANLIQKRLPTSTTLERNLKKRSEKKIYIDYLQNRSGQTIASVYSLRPKPGATVSMPVDWNELEKGITIADFNIHNALERLEAKGDIFKKVLGKGINMGASLGLLEEYMKKMK